MKKSEMKELVRHCFYSILSIINRIIPKSNQVFLYADECLYDSLEALARYYIEHPGITVLCMADEYDKSIMDSGNIAIIKSSLFHAIKLMFRSRVVVDISLHKIKIQPAPKQEIIQIWHGTPLKGFSERKSSFLQNGKYYSRILIPSPFFKPCFEKLFGCDDSKFVVLGKPRNDYLFLSERYIKWSDKNTRVMWLPTFRHGLGREETKKDIPLLDRENIAELDRFLKKEDIVLYIKPHPLQMIELQTQLVKIDCSNIIFLTDKELREKGIPLYSFLGSMNALITDYSSVFYDFLLLDRPIGFVIDDMKEYRSSRGFVFDNPLEYMPGEKIVSYRQLISFLLSVKNGEDLYKEERKKINEIANCYVDGKNCQRLYEYICQLMDR